MKTYMFDVDGVLADFVYGATQMMVDMGGFPLTAAYSTREQQRWDWPFDTSRLWAAIKESTNFWENLPVLVTPEEAKLVADLAEREIVYFTTSRAGKGNSKEQTERWLQKNLGVKSPTVIVTPNKGEFALANLVDYCIDDKAGNAVFVAYATRNAKKPTKSYVLNQQYNHWDQGVLGSKVIRVPTVAEFIAVTQADKQEK